jgi:prepilin-type N-terminal cleavage/methylation domain-containing protein
MALTLRAATRTRRRGLTMVELAVALVIVGAFVALFGAQARDLRQSRAADDLAAQARLDAVTSAVYTAYRPGVRPGELTVEDLALYTNALLTEGQIPLQSDGVTADRRYVSVVFGQGFELDEGDLTAGREGYFGLATLGSDGSCWLLKGRVGLTGRADTSLRTAEHLYFDYVDAFAGFEGGQGALTPDELARLSCRGEAALASTGGGSSWQGFVILDDVVRQFSVDP